MASFDQSRDADGPIAAHAWSFGDGASSSEASPKHVYPGPGSYQVTLTVTDDRGGKATSAQDVEVVAETPPP